MNASDSFDLAEFDVALDVVAPLINAGQWHSKWRVFQFCRVAVARGQLAIPLPLREIAGLLGCTDYWLSKLLRSMVMNDRVLLRDPPYPARPGSRPAMFALNPAVADWRGVPWSLARENVLARLGYLRARDRWVLPRSYGRGTNELSAALLLARHKKSAVPRPSRRGGAAQEIGSAALLKRGTNEDSAALLKRGTDLETVGAPPSYGVSKETLSRERHNFDNNNGNRGDGERDEEVLAAVLRVTGSPVWAGSRPEQRLMGVVRRDGPDAVMARINDLGRRGMHPAELVEWVAVRVNPSEDLADQLQKRLESLRRLIANQELVLRQRELDGYPVDDERAELDGYRAEVAQLEAELDREGSEHRLGGERDNGSTDDAMEVHA